MNDLLVVIRTSGERSRDLCVRLAREQADGVHVIEEKPFLKAVEKTFTLGAASPARFLLALDCDVLLYPGALAYICRTADQWLTDAVYRIDFLVGDKFRGDVCAGAHLYDNGKSAAILDHMRTQDQARTELRPESDNVVSFCRAEGLDYYRLRPVHPVGLHDHAQFLAHLVGKYSMRYDRCLVDGNYDEVEQGLKQAIKANPRDRDYEAALAGLHARRDGVSPADAAQRIGPEKGAITAAEEALLMQLLNRGTLPAQPEVEQLQG